MNESPTSVINVARTRIRRARKEDLFLECKKRTLFAPFAEAVFIFAPTPDGNGDGVRERQTELVPLFVFFYFNPRLLIERELEKLWLEKYFNWFLWSWCIHTSQSFSTLEQNTMCESYLWLKFWNLIRVIRGHVRYTLVSRSRTDVWRLRIYWLFLKINQMIIV